MYDNNVHLIAKLADLIREVDGSHSLGAATLAEALIERGVTLNGFGARRYAAATELEDGTVQPISSAFNTLGEAERDLAVLLGDDYYRDRRPFIAAGTEPTWRRVDVTASQ